MLHIVGLKLGCEIVTEIYLYDLYAQIQVLRGVMHMNMNPSSYILSLFRKLPYCWVAVFYDHMIQTELKLFF